MQKKKHSEERKGRQVKRERSTKGYRRNAQSLVSLFELYTEAKQAEGIAKDSLTMYKNAFNRFCEYLTLNEMKLELDVVTTEIIRGWIVWLLNDRVRFDGHKYKPDSAKRKGLSARTVHDYVKRMRAFFAFVKREGRTDHNAFDSVKNVKYQEKDITILSVEELRSLLKEPNQRYFTDFRNVVLMNLLIDSMTRINEALSLRISDIDNAAQSIIIRASVAKSRKMRIVPLKAKTIRLLNELIKENEDFDNEKNFVFLSNYGNRLTTNHFRKCLKKYAETVGIKKNVTPHLFRHTGATMFLEAGGDLRHLQQILGHNDLRMVMRYTHLTTKSVSDNHDRYSPMNAIEGKLNKPRKIRRGD